MVVHLAFSLPAIIRPNIPLLYPSFSAFDDSIPFSAWGAGGVLAALLLWLLPPRVPFGLLSTAYSAFYLYLIGAMYQQSAGLLPGTLLYRSFGIMSGLLFMRALWIWAEQKTWFRVHVMREKHGR
ncbi:hypothetical protein [Deinococcus xinjiangensis]